MLKRFGEKVVLSGRIKNTKIDKLPKNFLLGDNNTYKLILKNNDFKLSFVLNSIDNIKNNTITMYLPINIKHEFTSFTIYWGDNTSTTYINDNTPIELIANKESNICRLHHSNLTNLKELNDYPIKHIYNVKNIGLPTTVELIIKGDFPGFNNNYNFFHYLSKYANVNLLYFLNEQNNLTYYLEKITNWGNIPFKSLENFCCNAYGLNFIPNTILPNVNNCTSAFANCNGLSNCFNSNNMSNFALPLNCTEAVGMFENSQINYNFSTLKCPDFLHNIKNMFAGTKITDINKDFFIKLIPFQTNEFITVLSSFYENSIPNTITFDNITSQLPSMSENTYKMICEND